MSQAKGVIVSKRLGSRAVIPSEGASLSSVSVFTSGSSSGSKRKGHLKDL